MSNYKPKVAILIILIIAALFRFNNLNWDDGHHLHPDERFLTIVNNDTKLAKTFSDYLNPSISPLNPRNQNKHFFVYGNWPLIINKALAVKFENDNYTALTIQGRYLSVIADLLTVLVIFNIVLLIEKQHKISRKTKYFAAFIYGCSVLPIQLSHFYTSDIFLNFFITTSYYFILHFYRKKQYKTLITSAIFYGMALSTKISALYILPLIIFMILVSSKIKYLEKYKDIKNWLIFFKQVAGRIKYLLLFIIIAYFTVRLTDPYMFANNNLFDFTIHPEFISNIKELQSWKGEIVWFPPAIQWLTKQAITFSLQNMICFGVGCFISLFIFVGFTSGCRYFIHNVRRSMPVAASIIWIILFFNYQSTQFVKTMRYFIMFYPFMAIFGGIGFNYFWELKNKLSPNKIVRTVFKSILIGSLLIWPLMFSSIYFKPHSRVAASEWIYENIPEGSFIISEAWDDGLPLNIKNKTHRQYRGKQLDIYNRDNVIKFQEFSKILNQADYYIITSNRGYGSIPTAEHQYPLMGKFYEQLFAEQLGYKIIAEFTSYPSLEYLGIPISFADDQAEEAFSVYDHPKVTIFKKIDNSQPTLQ